MCLVGGPYGAAGPKSCFNYERTTKKSPRILGKKLGTKKLDVAQYKMFLLSHNFYLPFN